MSVKGTTLRVGRFLREVRSELRKVQWPNRRETVVLTSVVVGSVVLVVALVWVVDTILSLILGLVIR
ncbi:MAG: preprotein translocase subunit SecE [Bacillota bacterium]